LRRDVTKGAPVGRSVAQVAPDVYCLGPWGRIQTNAYLVRSGGSLVLIDAGWANDASRIDQAARTALLDLRR
jgi:glyoxylase-like metal-dependent hydrolase (beta-lactamase superfamily II)